MRAESVKPIKNIQYHCGKIVEAVYNHGSPDEVPGLGLVNLKLVEGHLAVLLVEVQGKPSEWQDLREKLQFEFELIKHAVAYLTNFLQNNESLHEEQLTAKIFATFLYKAVPEAVTKFQGG